MLYCIAAHVANVKALFLTDIIRFYLFLAAVDQLRAKFTADY